VIDSLTKDFYEYLTVKDIRVYDDKNKVYRDLSSKSKINDISHGENVEILEIFEDTPLRFNRLEVVIYDPNTKQEVKHEISLT